MEPYGLISYYGFCAYTPNGYQQSIAKMIKAIYSPLGDGG